MIDDVRDLEVDGGMEWVAMRTALIHALAEDVGGGWYFLRGPDTWVHWAVVGRALKRLESSRLLGLTDSLELALGFVVPGGSSSLLDLSPGLLLTAGAARRIIRMPVQQAHIHLSRAQLESEGIRVIHQPLMIPSGTSLPLDQWGRISEGVASGAWSVGQIRNHDLMDHLDDQTYGRRIFSGLLQENFADVFGQPSPDKEKQGAGYSRCESHSSLAEARSWLKFLHSEKMHIEVVHGFRGGYREFRSQHAVYRSEASQRLPRSGSSNVMMVARDCG